MSNVQRKNPLASVEAFRTAFPTGNERTGLVIKTRNSKLVASRFDAPHWQAVTDAAGTDPRIRIIDETFSNDEMAALLHSCDCYVSLHRSEGFGYGVAEAMLQGKPVIVTNYSAVTDFCSEENARLVPYEIVSPEPGMYPFMEPDRCYVWASPDTSAAA